MTGTKVSYRTVSAYSDLLSVPAMEKLMMEAMQKAENQSIRRRIMRMRHSLLLMKTPLPSTPTFSPADQTINLGSTDVGDVSWQIPTGLIGVATEATGCALHTWQIVAQGKSPLAHKGMHYAARILFAAAKSCMKARNSVNRFRKITGP